MKIIYSKEMQQETDELFIKACAANWTQLVHQANMSFIPNVYQIQCCVAKVGFHLNKCKLLYKKSYLQLC